jgi:hypothetical protein
VLTEEVVVEETIVVEAQSGHCSTELIFKTGFPGEKQTTLHSKPSTPVLRLCSPILPVTSRRDILLPNYRLPQPTPTVLRGPQAAPSGYQSGSIRASRSRSGRGPVNPRHIRLARRYRRRTPGTSVECRSHRQVMGGYSGPRARLRTLTTGLR